MGKRKALISVLLAAIMAAAAFSGCVFFEETAPTPTEQAAAVTAEPTELPTELPTEAPTEAPAEPPTQAPTETPTAIPTEIPTEAPTDTPKPTATPKPTRTPKPTGTPKPTATPKPGSPAPLPTGEPGDITLAFVGDLMCLSGQQYGAMNQAGSGERFDFSPSFRYVKGILSGAECALGNLETTISHSWPLSYEEKTIDGMPNCNGPEEYLDALKYAGFDALAMANNHCCDAGKQGILETIEAVSGKGFRHTGVFSSADERRFIILNVNGIKVGLLSYTEFYNGKQGCVGNDTFMLNTYSKSTAERDIAAARAAGAEFIIVYEHWGREHTEDPTSGQRQHAKELANAGADLICGSHSHTVQPSVWITANDGRKVLCFYSLGNFVSSMSQQAANDTVIALVDVKRGADGRPYISRESYRPCRCFSSVGGKYFVVLPTDETAFPGVKDQLQAAEARILRVLLKER